MYFEKLSGGRSAAIRLITAPISKDCLTECNDAVTRYVVDTVKVLDKQHMQTAFRGGLVVEQKIPSN